MGVHCLEQHEHPCLPCEGSKGLPPVSGSTVYLRGSVRISVCGRVICTAPAADLRTPLPRHAPSHHLTMVAGHSFGTGRTVPGGGGGVLLGSAEGGTNLCCIRLQSP